MVEKEIKLNEDKVVEMGRRVGKNELRKNIRKEKSEDIKKEECKKKKVGKIIGRNDGKIDKFRKVGLKMINK